MKNKDWIVKMRVTYIQNFYVSAPTKRVARERAQEFDSEEGGTEEMLDREVLAVEENK